MSSRIAELRSLLERVEKELEEELNRAPGELRHRIENGRIRFDRDVRAAHKAIRQGVLDFLADSQLLFIVTAPVIYSLIVPFGLLDLAVSLYQRVCFPVYRIRRVRRADHVVIDRQHLAYLNGIEKLNCVYCSYANGVIAFVREVAARTEQFWCPIRHAKRVKGPHGHYAAFVPYGDAVGYKKRLPMLRQELANPDQRPSAVDEIESRRSGT